MWGNGGYCRIDTEGNEAACGWAVWFPYCTTAGCFSPTVAQPLLNPAHHLLSVLDVLHDRLAAPATAPACRLGNTNPSTGVPTFAAVRMGSDAPLAGRPR